MKSKTILPSNPGSPLTRRQFMHLSAMAIGSLPLLASCGIADALSSAMMTPTASPVPATATPTATNTSTPVPPTATPTLTPKDTPIPPSETPTTSPTATDVPTPSRPWPLGDVPRSRTLIYYNNTPANGNFNAYSSGYNHQNGNAILYEPCAYYAVHADKIYLWLAESYQYNEDATTCTITFRKGIHWSDGKPFSARDVAWSMEKLRSVQGLNRSWIYQAEVKSIEVLDDYTLILNFNQPDPRFFYHSLTFRFDLGDDTAIQAPQMFAGVKDSRLANESLYKPGQGWPISTGPYGVGDSTELYTQYDLRPTWWAVESGFVDRYPDVWRVIQQPFTSDTLAAQLLINKEIDFTLDLRPFVVSSTLAQAEHLTTWTGRRPPYGYIDWWPISVQFCTMKPPFDNPKVRWAVAYALDQQQVVDTVWGGAGTVANSPFPNYPRLDKLMDGIKDITAQYNVLEANLDKVAQLMGEAGFTKDADGFWVDKDGIRPDSDLYAGVPLFGDLAPVVVEQLRQAGFFCQLMSPPDVWLAKVDGRASMFLFGHGGATIDPYDTFMLYYSVPMPMGEQDWANITRWQNDDFKKLTTDIGRLAMDDPKLPELFKEAMTIWYKNLPDCPLVQWYHRIPVSTWYWTNWPDEQNPYMNTALWHLTMLQVVLGLRATNP